MPTRSPTESLFPHFSAGDEDWWRYGADFVAYAKNEFGDWAPIEDQDEGHSGGASGPQ